MENMTHCSPDKTFMEFTGSNPNVKKYILKFRNNNVRANDEAIAEVVLYKYPDLETRTVICCSVQCGCPVGCSFCGTGKRFERNFTEHEIAYQVKKVLSHNGFTGSKRLQIMFMSMGEPFLNFRNVSEACKILQANYTTNDTISENVPDLYLSTIAPNTIIGNLPALKNLNMCCGNLGLQFSIHSAFDTDRDILIPYKQKLTLAEIAKIIKYFWFAETWKKARLNYCCTPDNVDKIDFDRLAAIFDPKCAKFTFSVVCSKDKCVRGDQRTDLTNYAVREMQKRGFMCHEFNPAGQDDIGGGCGQLHYVQDWFNSKKEQENE